MHADQPQPRSAYKTFSVLPTRWMDNDIYGHVNNVNYYSYFDTAIAHYLMNKGGLDPWKSGNHRLLRRERLPVQKGNPVSRDHYRRPARDPHRALQRSIRDRPVQGR